jgi:signal peptidase II
MPKRFSSAAFYSTALVLAVLDQITKALVRLKMPLEEAGTIPLWPGVFHFTHTTNRGMAFSLLWGQRWLLVLAAVIIGGMIVLNERKAQKSGGLERIQGIGMSLALAGAIGNLIDRAYQGFVTDFLDFRLIRFPIFNVADSCITIGIILLAAKMILTKEPRETREPEETVA